MKAILNLYSKLIKLSDMTLLHILNLAIRLHMAKFFWNSGLLRYEDWKNDAWEDQIEAFTEYHPIPGVDPALAAAGGTIGELVLPILLAFGLFTRIGAAGLLVMTLTIQFIVPAEYEVANVEHYHWMLLLLVPMLHGGGALSIDGIFQKIFGRKCSKSGEGDVCPLSHGQMDDAEEADVDVESDETTEQSA